MKPAIYFYKNLSVACLSVLLLLMPAGCVEDDLSICGISVHLRYTRNVDGVDKFSSSVRKINLFVFDSQGILMDEYATEGDSLPQDYTLYVNLEPGTYDLVAWGNLGEDYQLSPMPQIGLTHIDDLQLSLKREPGDIVNKLPEALYHGGLFRVEILSTDLQVNQTKVIDMMKDTKEIKVIASGLAIPTKAAGTAYDCTISSRNGDYRFDNSITGDAARLQYIPQATVDDENRLVSDFVIMREFNIDGTTATASRLTFTRDASISGEAAKLIDVDLRPYLLAATGDPANPADLDVWEKFQIELIFDETTGTVSISVNGWEDQPVTYNRL